MSSRSSFLLDRMQTSAALCTSLRSDRLPWISWRADTPRLNYAKSVTVNDFAWAAATAQVGADRSPPGRREVFDGRPFLDRRVHDRVLSRCQGGLEGCRTLW